MERFADAQAVVVQRQVSNENYDAIVNMKKLGLKVIYDTDDNLWSLPAANPMQKLFEQYQQGFVKCALVADTITVSTKGLRTALRTALPSFKGEILVCPNAIDFNLFRPASTLRDDRIVIGWAGSNTHGDDVKEAWHVLPDILNEFENVHMEFIGMGPPYAIHQHPRVRVRRFFPVGEYPSRLASWAWDITLAPLADNRFNKSKSNIKLLEAAALGIPCLVSPVQPYEEFCALGDLNWLMCYNENQWRKKLRDLVAEKQLRLELSSKMWNTAKMWFDIKKLKDNWIHAVETSLAN